MSDRAKFEYDHAQRFPFDADDDGLNAPHGDWAIKAARGIVADLSNRRQIKWGLNDIDHQTRIEIIATMASVIRFAKRRSRRERYKRVKK